MSKHRAENYQKVGGCLFKHKKALKRGFIYSAIHR